MEVVNAWVAYKEATKKKIQISKFRESLAEQLLNLEGVIHVAPASSSSTHTIWLRELEVMEDEYEEHVHSVMPK